MSANDIILYFSIFVGICVIIWAYFMINQYDKVNKED